MEIVRVRVKEKVNERVRVMETVKEMVNGMVME